ncbi:hypothetical protein ACP4OV_008297 [Aristida adscensionis]
MLIDIDVARSTKTARMRPIMHRLKASSCFGSLFHRARRSAMAAAGAAGADRPPPYVVLDDSVSLAPPPARLVREWAAVECARRKAYGCGDHGQEMVDGLTLYVRLIAPPASDLASALYIHAGDDALRGVWAEFGEDCGDARPGPIDGDGRYGMGFVESVDESLLVLTLLFRFNGRKIYYYLVYNAVDGGSLAMIRGLQDPSR